MGPERVPERLPRGAGFLASLEQSARLAHTAVRLHPGRSLLAIAGIVIGIVTVVLVASVLLNVRNQIALLFRELGTDSVFAFHRSGDPYSPVREKEASRRPLRPEWASEFTPPGSSIQAVAVQLIVPAVVGGRPVTARAGAYESDTLLLEGISANYHEVVGAEFAGGRSFTEVEDRVGARVAVLGTGLSRALFPGSSAVGRRLVLLGETYQVVGELEPRKGTFMGENRQDRTLAIPLGTARRRFPEAELTVLFLKAWPGQREGAFEEAQLILRRLRKLRPDQPDDFSLSTADLIIRTFDRVSARINLATLALAAVSLFIGGIGVANVMIIAVTERTREIGLRRAVGARRAEVLRQFLLEAVLLAGSGGVAGVGLALLLGLLITLFVRGFSAVAPLWAIGVALLGSVLVGVLAGYLPALRASRQDPAEALRHE